MNKNNATILLSRFANIELIMIWRYQLCYVASYY